MVLSYQVLASKYIYLWNPCASSSLPQVIGWLHRLSIGCSTWSAITRYQVCPHASKEEFASTADLKIELDSRTDRRRMLSIEREQSSFNSSFNWCLFWCPSLSCLTRDNNIRKQSSVVSTNKRWQNFPPDILIFDARLLLLKIAMLYRKWQKRHATSFCLQMKEGKGVLGFACLISWVCTYIQLRKPCLCFSHFIAWTTASTAAALISPVVSFCLQCSEQFSCCSGIDDDFACYRRTRGCGCFRTDSS